MSQMQPKANLDRDYALQALRLGYEAAGLVIKEALGPGNRRLYAELKAQLDSRFPEALETYKSEVLGKRGRRQAAL